MFSVLCFSLHPILSSQSTPKKVPIGIDLGTTFSCVAVFESRRVQVIASYMSSHLVPSIVSFQEPQLLVGDAAREQLTLNPSNTIYSIKRLMGLRFSEPQLQNELRLLPYKVVSRGDDRPYVEVTYHNKTERFLPEEISALILGEMKSMAEDYLGSEVTDAVITVPAYFNDAQRKATRDAGVLAKLNVLKILNEPTAACVAYGFDRIIKDHHTILVFDLGGGTFDVSVVVLHNNVFAVRAVSGDAHLGGTDFDARIVESLVATYARQTGRNVSDNKKAMAKLRRQATQAKIQLSLFKEVTIEIEAFENGRDFKAVLTRAHFDDLCSDLFLRTIALLEAMIADAKMRKEDIDEVVLVGGSTRIPKIQALVKAFFNDMRLSKSINPDEAVAWGAAIHAMSLLGNDSSLFPVIVDVNPLSIGWEDASRMMIVTIPRNSRIPAVGKIISTTHSDYQKSALFSVFEGERVIARDNHFLGVFVLDGLQAAPRGVPQIEVTFAIDADGLLSMSARDMVTKAENSLTLKFNDMTMSAAERDKAIRRAEEMKVHDEELKQAVQARARLENYLLGLQSRISQGKEVANEKVDAILKNGLKWVSENEPRSVEVFEKKLKEIENEIARIRKGEL